MRNPGRFLFLAVMFFLMSLRIVYAQEPYRILLTNDDGYDAPGIMTLYQELSSMPNTEVLIVAPNQNYSGAGHWVMLRDPFFVVDIKQRDKIIGHHVNVPPASCVAIGVRSLMNPKPDLVIPVLTGGLMRGWSRSAPVRSPGRVKGP